MIALPAGLEVRREIALGVRPFANGSELEALR